MKFKHIFFIWLLADVFLAIVSVIYLVENNNFENIIAWLIMGILFSLPSLFIMFLFHFLYKKFAKKTIGYLLPYCLLILGINICYLLSGQFGKVYDSSYKIFVATTVAGLLSFYIIHKRIKGAKL